MVVVLYWLLRKMLLNICISFSVFYSGYVGILLEKNLIAVKFCSTGWQESLRMMQSIVVGFLRIDMLMWFSILFTVMSRKLKEFSFSSSIVKFNVLYIWLNSSKTFFISRILLSQIIKKLAIYLLIFRKPITTPGTCNPEETGLPGPSVLITHPILWIWLHWTTTCPLDWKSNWKFAIFRLTQRSLLPRRHGWTDNCLNFFWVAWKS